MLSTNEIIDRLEVLYQSGVKAYYKNMASDIQASISYTDFRKLWKRIYNKHRVQKIKQGAKIKFPRKPVGKYRSTDKRKFIVCRYVPAAKGYQQTHHLTFTKMQYVKYMRRVFAGIRAHCSLQSIHYSNYMQDNLKISKIDSQFLIDLKYIKYVIGVDCEPMDLESAMIRVRDQYRFNPYEKYGYNTIDIEDKANKLLFIDDIYREL